MPASGGEAAPVVLDLQFQRSGGFIQDHTNSALLRRGVADGVGDRLLDDPVGGDFDGCGQIRQALGHLDRDGELRRIVLGGGLADGADESQVVERGRAESVDQAPDVGYRALGLGFEAPEQGSRGVGVLIQHVFSHIQLERKAAEHRAEPVVQVASQATALFLPGSDQPLPRTLEVRRETHGVGGYPGLAGEVFEQPSVGGGELSLAGAGAEQQLPYRLVLVS